MKVWHLWWGVWMLFTSSLVGLTDLFSVVRVCTCLWHVIPTLIKVIPFLLLLYANESGLLPLFAFILMSIWYVYTVISHILCVCRMASDLISLLNLNEFILSKCKHLPTSLWFLVPARAFTYCNTYCSK